MSQSLVKTMPFISNLEKILEILNKKQTASAEPISCEIARYYSVEEGRKTEQGEIVFGDFKSFHKIFNKFHNAQFKLKIVIGDTAQRFRHQMNDLTLDSAYKLSLKNGAYFIKLIRPAVLFLLKAKKNYNLNINIIMWDQELMGENFPRNCLPPPFDPNENDETYNEKHDNWYRTYTNRECSENNLSSQFKQSYNFAKEKCQNDIAEKLKKAALKYMANHEYKVSADVAVALSTNLFYEELTVFAISSSEILAYGINANANKIVKQKKASLKYFSFSLLGAVTNRAMRLSVFYCTCE
jgi:hypothetical protein